MMTTTDDARPAHAGPSETTPRAWIGCLACYNAGELRGDWVDGREAADFRPCDLMEDGDFHEEFWVLDHEGYGHMLHGECSPAEAQRLAEILDEATDGDALGAFVDHYGMTDDAEELLEAFEEAYAGEWSSERDFAEQLAEDVGYLAELPDHLRGYFNFQAFARDLFMGDYYSAPADSGRVYVFRAV